MTQPDLQAAKPRASPLISVIMANYRSAAYLPAALDSVLGQTVGDLEIIVSDDASPDASCEIVLRFAEADPRVQLIAARENRGPAAARNEALKRARGEWIAIVDSDDVLHPERFETMLAAAEALKADAVADDLLFCFENGESSGRTLLGSTAATGPMPISAEFFIRSNTAGSGLPPLGYVKPLFRRSTIAGAFYDENVRIAEDYDFLLRFLLGGGRFFLLPEPLYFYRRHPASISHRLSEDHVQRMIDGQKNLLLRQGALPPPIRELLDRRMTMLRRALSFEQLVSSLKERRLTDAVGKMVADPRLLAPLARSTWEHLHTRYKSTRRTTGGGVDAG